MRIVDRQTSRSYVEKRDDATPSQARSARPSEYLRACHPAVAIDRQLRQKGLDLGSAHRVGMPVAMKANGAFNPIRVSLFRAVSQVLDARDMTNLVQQFPGNLLAARNAGFGADKERYPAEARRLQKYGHGQYFPVKWTNVSSQVT